MGIQLFYYTYMYVRAGIFEDFDGWLRDSSRIKVFQTFVMHCSGLFILVYSLIRNLLHSKIVYEFFQSAISFNFFRQILNPKVPSFFFQIQIHYNSKGLRRLVSVYFAPFLNEEFNKREREFNFNLWKLKVRYSKIFGNIEAGNITYFVCDIRLIISVTQLVNPFTLVRNVNDCK